MRKRFYWLLACVILFGMTEASLAEIAISGDARVRYRMDLQTFKDETKGGNLTEKSIIDGYMLYRARINVKADIANGYYFFTKLSTLSEANFNKMGDDSGGKVLSGAHPSSSTGPVDFLNLYIGYKGKDLSFTAGKAPLKENVLLDIHYYPFAPFDIQWSLKNNDAFTGFTLGYAGLNTFLSVDNATVPTKYKGIQAPPDIAVNDQLSLGASYSVDFSGLTLTPTAIYTIEAVDDVKVKEKIKKDDKEVEIEVDRGNTLPMRFTLGLFGGYKIGDFAFDVGGGYSLSKVEQEKTDFLLDSHQNNNTVVAHIGVTAKKLWLGELLVFFDYALIQEKKWDVGVKKFADESEKYTTSYLHTQYTIPIAKSDDGKRVINIIPALRFINRAAEDDANGYQPYKTDAFDKFSRVKAEVNLEAKF